MFPKPPRPEPPRRAIAAHVVQQRDSRHVPDVLVVDSPVVQPPPANDAPVPATDR